MKVLAETIVNRILNMSYESPGFARINDSTEVARGKNQFLFFTKPELVRGLSRKNVSDIFAFLAERIESAAMNVESAVILNGRYMEKHGIVSAHYGVIDEATRRPAAFFSAKATDAFRSSFGRLPSDSEVLGGFDYMARFGIDAEELSGLWLTRELRKLASGMYCVHIKEKDVYLVNGFYPRMLLHFTREDSAVAGLTIRADMAWKELRSSFLGSTDPSKAVSGSIRRELLDRKGYFGLETVSANFNGVHASAGPVEALVELLRFTRDAGSGDASAAMDGFAFGKALLGRFPEHAVRAFCSNAQVRCDGKTTSVFDLTEELDSDAALDALSRAELLRL